MSDEKNSFPKPRRSASADAALRREIERVEKMTIQERMRAALSLGKEFSKVRISPKKKTP